MTNTEYVKHFKALVGVVKTYGCVYGCNPGLVATELVAQGVKPEDVATMDCAEIKKVKEVCRNCYLSCMLLRGANNGRYFQLEVDLSNNMMKGTNNFPNTIVKTMCLLTNCTPLPRGKRVHHPDGKGLAFTQGKGGVLRGLKGDSANKVKIGELHYKNECPELKLLDMGIQNLNMNNCGKEHTLFSANNGYGYGLVQKQTKGVQGILSVGDSVSKLVLGFF